MLTCQSKQLKNVIIKTFECPVCIIECMLQVLLVYMSSSQPGANPLLNMMMMIRGRNKNSQTEGKKHSSNKRVGERPDSKHDRGEYFLVGQMSFFFSLRKSTRHSLYMHVCIVCVLLCSIEECQESNVSLLNQALLSTGRSPPSPPLPAFPFSLFSLNLQDH